MKLIALLLGAASVAGRVLPSARFFGSCKAIPVLTVVFRLQDLSAQYAVWKAKHAASRLSVQRGLAVRGPEQRGSVTCAFSSGLEGVLAVASPYSSRGTLIRTCPGSESESPLDSRLYPSRSRRTTTSVSPSGRTTTRSCRSTTRRRGATRQATIALSDRFIHVSRGLACLLLRAALSTACSTVLDWDTYL